MTLPESWALVPVTARYAYLDGSTPVGSVRFDSARVVIVGDVVVVPRRIVARLDAEGCIALDLPATNDPDLSATGWEYTVTEFFPGGRKAYKLQVDHEAEGIDLSAPHPIAPPRPPVIHLAGGPPWDGFGETGPATLPSGERFVLVDTRS